jgi:excisionase family DNA binding protein
VINHAHTNVKIDFMKSNLNGNHSSGLLTAREVCEQLRLPRSTVYYLTQIGKIRAVRIGKHWRYRKQDIDQYLNGQVFSSPQDRRRNPRLNASLVCQWSIVIENRKSVSGSGQIQNISQGGLLVKNEKFNSQDNSLEADDPIELTCDEMGTIQGRVVRVEKNGHCHFAVIFRHLPEEVKQKIREFIG